MRTLAETDFKSTPVAHNMLCLTIKQCFSSPRRVTCHCIYCTPSRVIVWMGGETDFQEIIFKSKWNKRQWICQVSPKSMLLEAANAIFQVKEFKYKQTTTTKHIDWTTNILFWTFRPLKETNDSETILLSELFCVWCIRQRVSVHNSFRLVSSCIVQPFLPRNTGATQLLQVQ